MNINKLKPVPKYIVQRIRKEDRLLYPSQTGYTRFYAYLAKNEGKLIKVTVAVRNESKRRNSHWVYKQVAARDVKSNICYVKDMIHFRLSGYVVGWFSEGIGKYQKWWEDGEWGWANSKCFDPYAPIVNMDYMQKFPEYKYSCYQEIQHCRLFEYLQIYEHYPVTAELMVKLGLKDYVFYKTIIHRLDKDKNFRRWVLANRENVATNRYYATALLRAYNRKMPLEQAQAEISTRQMLKSNDYAVIRNLFHNDLTAITNYIASQNTNLRSYKDYADACAYLQLDMTLERNYMPHDFKRWHDIRINEYHSKKAEQDKKEKRELYEKFKKVADKYMRLEQKTGANFICIIAQSPQDLIREGHILHHCVGSMGYDQKFVREQSLIFFIRDIEAADTPLLTVEYSVEQKKVLQCYGEHDNRPTKDIEDFVYEQWLPYANKQIKKIQKQAA